MLLRCAPNVAGIRSGFLRNVARSRYHGAMRRLVLLVALLLSAQIGSARADVTETVDIANVTFPDGWQRTAKERTYVLYETTDATGLCRLYAMVSTASTGGLDGDFDAE